MSSVKFPEKQMEIIGGKYSQKARGNNSLHAVVYKFSKRELALHISMLAGKISMLTFFQTAFETVYLLANIKRLLVIT
jgi:hypothetical protein